MQAPARQRLRLYADRDGHGQIHTTYLILDPDSLWIGVASEPTADEPAATPTLQAIGPLSYLALRVVFGRYGRALEAGFDLSAHQVADDAEDAPLFIGDAAGNQASLCRFRYKPFGWVYPADYLLWSEATAEPQAAEAPLIKSALCALALRAARSA